MKLRIAILCLALCLLLTSCASLLNRSYTAETEHIQFSDKEQGADVLQAETYQRLVSAILYLVAQGEEAGVIRLAEYTGSPEEDLEAACMEISDWDPLGSYAVDYIRYELSPVLTYYEVELKIVYQRSFQQIADVISVTGGNAVLGELREALADFREETVLRVNYFDRSMQPEDVEAMVKEAYYDVPQSAFGMPQAQVQMFPAQLRDDVAGQPGGQQRVVEIILTYPELAEALREKQAQLVSRAEGMARPLEALEEGQRCDALAKLLKKQTALTAASPETATAYAALMGGEADAEGMALAMALLCQEAGLSCQVVEGSVGGAPHFWNLVLADGQWRHWDLTWEEPQAMEDTAMEDAGYLWSGGVPASQRITGVSTE